MLGSSPGGYDISRLHGFRGEGDLEVSRGGLFISLEGLRKVRVGGYSIGLLAVRAGSGILVANSGRGGGRGYIGESLVPYEAVLYWSVGCSVKQSYVSVEV